MLFFERDTGSLCVLKTACESVSQVFFFFLTKRETDQKIAVWVVYAQPCKPLYGHTQFGRSLWLPDFISQVNSSDSLRPEKLRFRVLMEEPALERREAQLYLKLRRGDKESCRGSWLCGESWAIDRAVWVMVKPSKTAGRGWGDFGEGRGLTQICRWVAWAQLRLAA